MMYALRVTDNLSSSGITGVSSLKICGSEARIVDFVLSCRVFGRQIEYAMIHLASMFARKKGAMSLIAEIVDTPKNSVCRQFFEGLDFEMSNNAFTLQLSKPYPAPKCIEIINDGVI
jgi:predicted enzyme involved in methoxymalonyl-ACP biosynthesis